MGCHGSPEKVADWMKAGGANGKNIAVTFRDKEGAVAE
jgi:hypothetical protein